MSGFHEMIRASRLSYPDLEWLSNGVLTRNKLEKHNNGVTLLSVADYTLLLEILEQHRAFANGIRLLTIQRQKAAHKPEPVAAVAAVPAPKADRRGRHMKKGEIPASLAKWWASQTAQKAGAA